MHDIIFQPQGFVRLNNHKYNCNITKSFLSVSLVVIILHSVHHDYTDLCDTLREESSQTNVILQYKLLA